MFAFQGVHVNVFHRQYRRILSLHRELHYGRKIFPFAINIDPWGTEYDGYGR